MEGVHPSWVKETRKCKDDLFIFLQLLRYCVCFEISEGGYTPIFFFVCWCLIFVCVWTIHSNIKGDQPILNYTWTSTCMNHPSVWRSKIFQSCSFLHPSPHFTNCVTQRDDVAQNIIYISIPLYVVFHLTHLLILTSDDKCFCPLPHPPFEHTHPQKQKHTVDHKIPHTHTVCHTYMCVWEQHALRDRVGSMYTTSITRFIRKVPIMDLIFDCWYGVFLLYLWMWITHVCVTIDRDLNISLFLPHTKLYSFIFFKQCLHTHPLKVIIYVYIYRRWKRNRLGYIYRRWKRNRLGYI